MEKSLQVQSKYSLEDLKTIADSLAKSGMFGVRTSDQALSLMLLCEAEQMHPMMAVRRYHIIENKPSMRADTMQGEFQAKGGSILFHKRDATECSGTLFVNGSKVTPEDVNRARSRYKAMKEGKSVDDLYMPGEVTIIRTMEDELRTKVACSWDKDKREWKTKHVWQQNPKAMLHARFISEGVRAIMPGIIAGIYTPEDIEDVVDDPNAMPEGYSDEDVESSMVQKLKDQGLSEEEAREQAQPFEPTPKKTYKENPPVVEVQSEVLPPDKPKDWREVLCIAPKSYKESGKKIGELTPAQLYKLYTKWVIPNSSKFGEDVEMKNYAHAISDGIEYYDEMGQLPKEEDSAKAENSTQTELPA